MHKWCCHLQVSGRHPRILCFCVLEAEVTVAVTSTGASQGIAERGCSLTWVSVKLLKCVGLLVVVTSSSLS